MKTVVSQHCLTNSAVTTQSTTPPPIRRQQYTETTWYMSQVHLCTGNIQVKDIYDLFKIYLTLQLSRKFNLLSARY